MDNITKDEKKQFVSYRNQKVSGDLLITVPYDYTDENGNLLFQVVREQYQDGKKFFQRRPDGNGGWINNLKGVKTTIYHLPEVIEAVNQGKTVFIVEGEKDVETLRSLQLTATTSPMGAGKWKKEYCKHFKGAAVVIFPDNDAVGRKHAEDVAAQLIGVARSLKVVELPDTQEHEDVTDWLTKRGGTKDRLLQLVNEAPEYKDTLQRICVTLGKSDKNSLENNAKKVCEALNRQGIYYWKAGMVKSGLGHVVFDHEGAPSFCLLSKDDIFNAISKVAYSENKKGLPPKELAAYIYGMSGVETPFKPLEKVVRVPVFSSDGRLICEPGYYSRDKLLYIPRAGSNIRIPLNPTKEEIQEAKSLLEDDILVDFNFETHADKTHAIAYILLFLVREMIEGPTPLHIFEAAKQGTGKTLLAESLMKTLTLGNYAIVSKSDDEELRKSITSSVLNGVSGFCLDNVTELKSPLLAQILLTQQYNDRLLGTNKQINTVIKWVWAATGNNIAVDTDIARRSIRVRFTSDVEHPGLRPAESFKHPKLHKWCQENTDRIIQSGITLVQAWIAAGRPHFGGVNYGGFESWAETIGDILTFHEYKDFLGNVLEFYEEADRDAYAWRSLLEVWWSTFGDKPVTAGDVLPLAVGIEGLYLGKDDKETSKKNYLSRTLTGRKDTVTTVNSGDTTVSLKLVKGAHSKAGFLWSLRTVQPKIKIYKHDEKDQQAENTVVVRVPANNGDGSDGSDAFLPYTEKKEEEKEIKNLYRVQNPSFASPASPEIVGSLAITEFSVTPACTRPIGDIERCIRDQEIALDLETTGTDICEDRLCVLSVATKDDYWIMQNPPEELLRHVVSLPKLIIGHNLAFDIAFLSKVLGRRLKLNVFDTMLAAQLIECEAADEEDIWERFTLEKVTKRYLGIAMDKTLQTCDWSRPLTEQHIKYCINDVQVPLKLYERQKELLEKDELTKAADLEFGCVPATAEMKLNGFRFDMEGARRLLNNLVLPDNMDPNPFSAKKILEYFKGQNITLSDTKEATLKKIDHDMARKILEYRGIKKSRDILEKCLKYAAEHDGRIHADLFQLGAATGRYTCSKPNLQQIPRDKEFRNLFIPSDGHLLVGGDWSAIELRIMASLSGDQTMLKAFAEGQDLHRLTASKISGKAPDQITSAERNMAKAVNFGLIYGMGKERLQEYARNNFGTNMTVEEAKKARRVFFETYRRIKEYHNYINNISEQTYYFPGWPDFVEKPVKLVRSRSGRARIVGKEGTDKIQFTTAVNHPDQGTGVDMLKAALALLYNETDYRLLLPVHDEILIEVPEEEAEHAKEVLNDIMVRAGKEFIDPVPVEAEVKVGRSWGECH